ncbi:MAG: 4'-phosphopantetheinyl transferase family protein [Desertimonas sp.]
MSLAHAPGWVAAVAGPPPVGIDIEPVDDRALSSYPVALGCHPTERRRIAWCDRPAAGFLHLWTAKEALVKAGQADVDGFATLDVSGLLDGPRLCTGPVTLARLTVPGDQRVAATVALPTGVGAVVDGAVSP